MRENIVPISIVVSGILISMSIYFGFGLDVIQKLLSIVGSLSIAVALSAYFYKRDQDRTMAAIEQISFFRKEIIPEWEKAAVMLKTKNKKYMFSQVELDEPTIDFIRRKYPRKFQDQKNIFFNDFKVDQELWDPVILDSQIRLFNMLEEFSLKVYHFGTAQHQALNAVRAAFVEIIEKNAVAVIFVRDVVVGNPIYASTLLLYQSWKGGVDRSFIIKRLAKHGFITNKQKDEVFKKIRESRTIEAGQ